MDHREKEKNQITGVKNAPKELSSEQNHSNTRDDRAAFVQVGRVEYVRLLHETRCYESMSENESLSDKSGSAESEHEFITATESEREETQSVEGSTESDPGEQTTSNSEEENTKEERGKKVSTKKFKIRKKKTQRELDWSSNSKESSTESVDLSYTDNEDYSDDDHILLVTSVANLRRRENMKLKPLRTRSKRAPNFKDDSDKKEKNPNFWNLDKTKDVIQEY